MNVSENKIEANRENAKKSTGPRTAEGKSRSSRNATRHGLTSQRLIVRDDEQDEFFNFHKQLRQRIKPVGATEEEVFRQLLRSAWNLRRIERLEDELFDGSEDPLGDPDLDARMDRLGKYQVRYERSFYRSIRELRRLQTDRVMKIRSPEPVARLITDLVSTSELIKRTQNMIGFQLEKNVYKQQEDAIRDATREDTEKAA